MKKAISLILAATLAMGALAGLAAAPHPRASSASGAGSAPASPTASAPAPAESSEAASTPAGDEIRVAMVLKTLSNPFWVDMADGIQAEAKSRRDSGYFRCRRETDIDGQLKKCEDAINSGSYDGLGVAPITATNLISAVVAANQKGMPVVNIDAKIDEDALKEAGRLCGRLCDER